MGRMVNLSGLLGSRCFGARQEGVEKMVWRQYQCPVADMISRKGIITKSRSCIRGCGRVSVGVERWRLPYISRSMSMGRSWYMPSCDFVFRPNSRSICCVRSRHCSGASAVRTRQAALRNGFSLWKPHGSVWMNDETRCTVPMRSSINAMARCNISSLSPRFEPRERYRFSSFGEWA